MAIYTAKDGARRELSSFYTAADGMQYSIGTLCTRENGIGRVVFSSAEHAALASFSVGTTVYLPEGGRTVPYTIWDKEYQSCGQVLLLRNHPLSVGARFFDDEGEKQYEDSGADLFLRESYFPTLSARVRECAVTASIPVMVGGSIMTPSAIERSVFLLSKGEVGGYEELHYTIAGNDLDGRPLPYAVMDMEASLGQRRVCCTEEGVPIVWWLRTPNMTTEDRDTDNNAVGENGALITAKANGTQAYLRPAIVLREEYVVEYDG